MSMRNYTQVDNGLETITNMLNTAKAGMENKNITEKRVYELLVNSLNVLDQVHVLVRREK